MDNCFICRENSELDDFCLIDSFQYVKCTKCGLLFIKNTADTEILYRSYIGKGFKKFRRQLLNRYRKFRNSKDFAAHMARTKKITDFASSMYAHDTSDHIKLFDIGCNKGFLLANALKRNWDVYGNELVGEIITPFINAHHSITDHIYIGKLEDVESGLESNYFDIITAIDIVEHFEDPYKDIATMYRVLKPGGLIIIQTPDTSSQNATKYKCEWGALRPLEHIVVFNKDNLEIALGAAGFSSIINHIAFEIPDENFLVIARK